MHDDAIREYVRTHGAAYTREAVRDHLVAAGHDQARVDAIWGEEWGPPATDSSTQTGLSRQGITVYVIASFVVGLVAVLGLILFNLRSLTATLQFEVIWVVGYIVVGAIVGYFITRFRVAGGWWVLAAPLVPILYIVVWFGTCIAAYRTI